MAKSITPVFLALCRIFEPKTQLELIFFFLETRVFGLIIGVAEVQPLASRWPDSAGPLIQPRFTLRAGRQTPPNSRTQARPYHSYPLHSRHSTSSGLYHIIQPHRSSTSRMAGQTGGKPLANSQQARHGSAVHRPSPATGRQGALHSRPAPTAAPRRPQAAGGGVEKPLPPNPPGGRASHYPP